MTLHDLALVRSPTATGGRDEFTAGDTFHDWRRSAFGALHPEISIWGAHRSCMVVNFSPVKQVTIKDRWYVSCAP